MTAAVLVAFVFLGVIASGIRAVDDLIHDHTPAPGPSLDVVWRDVADLFDEETS